ncbi:DDRGK domain-containing protein 1-like isoform X3 [Pollicipes pollicipes]|uniref:DDRGK domain-containing protein 1-like isoform X3 n=1 Tax=Pollicipes pollicipes TaxID=41117 RepID=UPI001884D5D5|nr:DDRGK domain-containing protein 1-like isoform X3 [Pollicipes pollicipes]
MNPLSILLVLAPLLTILIFILALIKSRQTAEPPGHGARVRDTDARGAGAVVQPARRAATARNRNRMRMGGEESEDSDGGARDPIDAPEGKVGKKKLAKLEAKAEKKAQREAEEKEREERKKRQEQDEQERREQEKLEEEQEQAREEAERLAREERERQEHEEYIKLKEAFGVDEEGFDEELEDEKESKLQEFINYIKSVKVVLLEDLGAQFGLKTQDAIDRLQTLMSDGTLSGVIDDRGKFIYIPTSELEAVAKFIRQRGRVSLADLVENSNSLISLTPETSQKS